MPGPLSSSDGKCTNPCAAPVPHHRRTMARRQSNLDRIQSDPSQLADYAGRVSRLAMAAKQGRGRERIRHAVLRASNVARIIPNEMMPSGGRRSRRRRDRIGARRAPSPLRQIGGYLCTSAGARRRGAGAYACVSVKVRPTLRWSEQNSNPSSAVGGRRRPPAQGSRHC